MLIIFIWMIILAVRKGKSLKQLLVKGLHLSSEIICFFEEHENYKSLIQDILKR